MNGVQLLLIVGAGIAVAAVAHKRGFQPGLVVVVLAAAISFVPGVPRLELESELILAIVVPPLLYSATRGASFTAFGQNLRPIINLGVVLVVLTTGALGLLSSWLLPSMGLAAAFVLGAVLAPPDTITTVTHGRELGLPRRSTAILTGESLVNDATALTLFSIAVAWVGGEHTSFGGGFLELVRAAAAGAGIGAVLAVATLLLRRRLGNPTLETTLTLLVPFTAFLLAEQVHASGIIAVVVAAFSISINTSLDPNHQYPGAYRTRLQEAAFWPVMDFLLETFVFAYIGLQLGFVVHELAEGDELARTLVAAGVLLVAAIVLRMAGVFLLFGRWQLSDRARRARLARDPELAARIEERHARRRRGPTGGPRGSGPKAGRGGGRPLRLGPPSVRENVIVGWTGMRGILTLAAAAAVPESIPGRDSIQAIALIVTLGTLLIQGTTIRQVIRWLHLDTSAENAEADAMRARGLDLATAAGEGWEQQRHALSEAVMLGHVDEETAKQLIGDIDLRQAAAQTLDQDRA